ncbi:unnamed protein product [Didymodactylos carnosus]|nr:unnamed protein product [Didymodactylos carnosus]CAF3880359.1 unnamed protein product [Didymodactylos carnosus]
MQDNLAQESLDDNLSQPSLPAPYDKSIKETTITTQSEQRHNQISSPNYDKENKQILQRPTRKRPRQTTTAYIIQPKKSERLAKRLLC